MNKLSKNENGFTIISIALVVIMVALVGALGWLTYKNHQKSSTVTSASVATVSHNQSAAFTNKQIFQQVSTQLHIARDTVVFFRVFGQDKVQYSTTSSGNTYAYKVSGTWKIAATNVQSVVLCSMLNGVPEQYRPPCGDSDSTNTQVHYMNPDNTSTNYPVAKAVSYIGQ